MTTLSRAPCTGALLRLFTDSSLSAVSDIVFEANGGQVNREVGQFYGWENWIQLTGANESIGKDGGELPLFSLFSSRFPNDKGFLGFTIQIQQTKTR